VTRDQFQKNLYAKRSDTDFRSDVLPLLRPGTVWDFDKAMDIVQNEIISRLPG
jgi:hypothetical protein